MASIVDNNRDSTMYNKEPLRCNAMSHNLVPIDGKPSSNNPDFTLFVQRLSCGEDNDEFVWTCDIPQYLAVPALQPSSS
jgi:hypothetical protein